MSTLLYYATTVAVVAVIIVLMMGLVSLARGNNPRMSQLLMRWRIGLQLAAIMIIVAYVLVTHA